MQESFRKLAGAISRMAGSAWTFFAALALIIVWLISGPIFKFSDTWQLVINTATTIITFLMVFLIQNTQNRETKAINLKLDELLRAVEEARTRMVDLEDAPDEELENMHVEFQHLREQIADTEEQIKDKTEKSKAQRKMKPNN